MVYHKKRGIPFRFFSGPAVYPGTVNNLPPLRLFGVLSAIDIQMFIMMKPEYSGRGVVDG
jgi:hypothetical protein